MIKRTFQPTQAQSARINKSRERFKFQLWLNAWQVSQTNDWQFRLVALSTILPDETIRQTFNRAKLNIRG